MLKFKIVFVFLSCQLIAVCALSASESLVNSLAYDFHVEMFERFYSDNNFLDRYDHAFERTERYNQLNIDPSLQVGFGKSVDAFAAADLDWGHLFSPGNDDAVDIRITNLYLRLHGRQGHLQTGFMAMEFGRGLISASDAPGGQADYRLGKDMRVGLQLAQVMESSPMVEVSLAYKFAFLETVELYGVWFQDRDNGLARLLSGAEMRNGLSSSGDLFWIGFGSDFFLGPIYCSGSAIWQTGDVATAFGRWQRTADMNGYLADLEMNIPLARWLSGSVFCFLASGDADIRNGNLETFISPMPFNPRAAIFFNPEFFDRDFLSEDLLWPGGMTFSGVIAPGLRFDLKLREDLSVGWTAVTFFSEKRSVDTKDWYGWETDFTAVYSVTSYLDAVIEADFFTHGNYFESKEGVVPDPASRIGAGFTAYF